ncbi:glycosyltransferase involved in cell wall biosynthesis [Motilibacter peucedani]|uniref:Glycosyltransferase involved in cell wall biosynthesis n=1 Tax=Motilibacter peucedani TaxID=598650 RepID=A0A420XVF1_9ACTN|nr:glycosyltransferase family 4 protein [Motilibacter peucedani]RKS80730.1 glycosyltransferase involved in cell wall biosynthesis [Motilibacter peucedani]
MSTRKDVRESPSGTTEETVLQPENGTTSAHDTSSRRPVVLHVVEAWGGGVMSAVLAYAQSAPAYRHVALAAPREGHDTGEVAERDGVTLREMPRSRRAALRAIAAEYRSLRPDVVHAHSSYGGVLARLCGAIPREKIVYTPHCYAFERRDVPVPARWAFYAVERLLALRTGVTAGCSPREVELARAMLPGSRRPTGAAYVPNVVRVEHSPRRRGGPLTVVGVGRLDAQKSPEFFRAVVAAARPVDPTLRWLWLGGGSPESVEQMRAAGVETSGWLPRPELLQQLAEGDIYLHTAAWEGAPISALEAAALGLPVVGRAIPAMASLGLQRLASTPEQVAELVLALREPSERAVAVAESAELNSRHSPEHQVAALTGVYDAVSGRVPEPAVTLDRTIPLERTITLDAHVVDLSRAERERTSASRTGAVSRRPDTDPSTQ